MSCDLLLALIEDWTNCKMKTAGKHRAPPGGGNRICKAVIPWYYLYVNREIKNVVNFSFPFENGGICSTATAFVLSVYASSLMLYSVCTRKGQTVDQIEPCFSAYKVPCLLWELVEIAAVVRWDDEVPGATGTCRGELVQDGGMFGDDSPIGWLLGLDNGALENGALWGDGDCLFAGDEAHSCSSTVTGRRGD
jgi:hypothetical protein